MRLALKLSLFLALSAPTWAATILVPFSLTVSDPTFNRTLSFLQGGTPTLSAVGTAVHYTTVSHFLSAPSDLLVSLVDADGASVNPTQADTFLLLYGPGGFNPNSPLVNAIMANDDAAGVRSRMVTNTPLGAGTYTIVITSFDNTPGGLGSLPWTGNLLIRDDLNAVPEPATYALSAAALLLFALRRRSQSAAR